MAQIRQLDLMWHVETVQPLQEAIETAVIQPYVQDRQLRIRLSEAIAKCRLPVLIAGVRLTVSPPKIEPAILLGRVPGPSIDKIDVVGFEQGRVVLPLSLTASRLTGSRERWPKRSAE